MMHPSQLEEFETVNESEELVHVSRVSDMDFIEAAREEYHPTYNWQPRDWSYTSPFDVEVARHLSRTNMARFWLREKLPQESRPSPLYEQDELESTFHANVEQWREDTGMFASIAQRAMHPSYLRVIGLGRQAIPLLLGELRERPDHWFWALRAVAGDDPVSPESDFDEAVEAWVQWGRENGYIG